MSQRLIGNLVGYQVAWFATVLGAAHGQTTLGSSIALAAIALHLRNSHFRNAESLMVLITLLVGLVVESLLGLRELILYEGPSFVEHIPLWILVLWAAFGTTLNTALKWFQSRLITASLFGAICGPLSWYAGAKLGALKLPVPYEGYLALSIAWAISMPFLSWMTRWLFSRSQLINERKNTHD